MHAWFYEAFEEEAHAIRAHLPARIRVGFCAETLAESGHDAPPAPLISTRTQSVVPASWYGGVQAVLSRSTGYDHLLALHADGFTGGLGHLPLYCHRAVAEHALLMMLALLRKLQRQTTQFGRFQRDGLTGRELKGRTVAIFGVGQIGGELADMLEALGMNVIGVDVRDLPHASGVSPEEAIRAADVLVCAMDLNEGNPGYFSRELLAGAREGAVFVNVSRGELSPSTVLLEMLETGVLHGVALDVYTHEKALAVPLRSGKIPVDPEALAALELADHPDAICTPHNAFNSEEAVERKSSQSVQQVVEWTDNGRFLWPVRLA